MNLEPWAQLIIERELAHTVHIHDDGSAPSMYDLRVGSTTEPLIAIECVGAVNATVAAFWNAGPARGPLQTDLVGDWIVVLRPKTQVKALRNGVLNDILRPWDGDTAKDMYVDWQLERTHPVLFERLVKLGIVSVHCVRQRGSGKVFLNPEDIGGIVDEHGTVISTWIGEFLRAKERADVITKLEHARCRNCHVFVPIDWSGAPWEVESYLISGLEYLPEGKPDLPRPVTATWIVSLNATHGIRWDGICWRRFDARTENAK